MRHHRTAATVAFIGAACVALGATRADAASTALRPEAAAAKGVPTLLSKDVSPAWIAYPHPSVLAFFSKTNKNLGLKKLAAEYKGRLAVGGVHPAHAAMHKHFKVTEAELPAYLVVVSGATSMRLSGGSSNLGTLKMLLQSVVSQHVTPPPPPPLPTPVTASTLRPRCAAVKGTCMVVASTRRARRKTMAIVARLLRAADKKPTALWADIDDAAVAGALGREGNGAANTMVRVVKGYARPRIASFAGDVVTQQKQFSSFVDDLSSGLLSFERFAWPKEAEGSAPSTVPPPPPPTRPREFVKDTVKGDGRSATFGERSGAEEVQEIELEDDDDE